MVSLKISFLLPKPLLKSCCVPALFLCLSGFSALAQDEPVKPQLNSTPLPENSPAQQPAGVIVQPAATESPERSRQSPERIEVDGGPAKEEKVPFKDRLMVNGNFGLQFGDWTLINISPLVGYKFSERFVAGPGAIYQYQSYRGLGSFHMYGAKLFGRALVFNNVFAHTEYELLNMPKINYNAGEIEESRIIVPSLFLGGGYRFMMGARTSVDALVLFNLLESRYSPYANPLLRIGFTGGW